MRKWMIGSGLAPVIALVVALLGAQPNAAGDEWGMGLSPSVGGAVGAPQESGGGAAAQPPTSETVVAEKTTVTTTTEPASPLSFGLTYAIYTDYIFRGANFSEYPGEGREKLNHQLSLDVGVDVGLLFGEGSGTWGTFSFNTWFEWFAAQKRLDPIQGGQNLQEVDYNLSWSYEVASIATTFTLGYSFWTFPNSKSVNSMEWKVGLEHNDAWMWKWLWADNEDGVLNPFFTFYHDVDQLAGASWMECGFSHDFAVCENVTVTPSMTFAIDHRYLDRMVATGFTGSTRLAYIQYGLNVGYDLSSALSLPENIGSVVLTGFLYFNDAVGHPESSNTIQDEFFGGMSLGWSF